jgi:hypothetical protein
MSSSELLTPFALATGDPQPLHLSFSRTHEPSSKRGSSFGRITRWFGVETCWPTTATPELGFEKK